MYTHTHTDIYIYTQQHVQVCDKTILLRCIHFYDLWRLFYTLFENYLRYVGVIGLLN
jgi:hypothetical protein